MSCRICLGDNKPLIEIPCDCKGTIGKIHRECLLKMKEDVCGVCKKIFAFNYEIRRERKMRDRRLKRERRMRRKDMNDEAFLGVLWYMSLLMCVFLYLIVKGIVLSRGYLNFSINFDIYAMMPISVYLFYNVLENVSLLR